MVVTMFEFVVAIFISVTIIIALVKRPLTITSLANVWVCH